MEARHEEYNVNGETEHWIILSKIVKFLTNDHCEVSEVIVVHCTAYPDDRHVHLIDEVIYRHYVVNKLKQLRIQYVDFELAVVPWFRVRIDHERH